jgi:hypothetical protein
MFSEYENIEPIIYKQMKKCSENLFHAYLFNLNGNVYAESMIIAFVKASYAAIIIQYLSMKNVNYVRELVMVITWN